MDSVIELQRQTHEEIERYECALYTILSRAQSTHELKVQNEHKASQMLDRISAKVVALDALYEDGDARKAEIEALTSTSQQSDLQEFYSRLVKIQEHHNKYPDAVSGGIELELAALLEEPDQDDVADEFEEEDPIGLLFTGEEGYGKYVDLYALHVEYTNLKNIGRRPGYLQYLDVLLEALNGLVHQEVPRETRSSKAYESYIKNLYQYLLSFTKRSQPLLDVDTQQKEAETQFEQKWEAQELPGWEEQKDDAQANDNGGIWCAACQRHYSKQTVYDAHLTSKKHIKATQKQANTASAPTNPNGTEATPPPALVINANKLRFRESARLTYLSTKLIDFLSSTINDTKSNVERRFSLTAREREQELLEQNKPPPMPAVTGEEGAEEKEEEEERIYNPLKLPLGWDGKPIPYWLYKLHGLGVEYRCEICSDHVYMGRKNFDRHFQESRHAFGMRALGLPNTKHFHEITRIEDALALAEKLKQEGRHEIFQQETMEELEDDEGNVYNRKTYEDLKKQGLI
ncbi:hypothetical protein AX16_007226 [Volvariella volvacea WC 439]|nr:hypothetical protein AX16_007226 [Volvariella volvacea WC 439]